MPRRRDMSAFCRVTQIAAQPEAAPAPAPAPKPKAKAKAKPIKAAQKTEPQLLPYNADASNLELADVGTSDIEPDAGGDDLDAFDADEPRDFTAIEEEDDVIEDHSDSEEASPSEHSLFCSECSEDMQDDMPNRHAWRMTKQTRSDLPFFKCPQLVAESEDCLL